MNCTHLLRLYGNDKAPLTLAITLSHDFKEEIWFIHASDRVLVLWRWFVYSSCPFLSSENLKQKIAKLISALNDTLVTSWPPI